MADSPVWPPDELVEKAARALWQFDLDQFDPSPEPEPQPHDDTYFARKARAVLSSLGSEMVPRGEFERLREAYDRQLEWRNEDMDALVAADGLREPVNLAIGFLDALAEATHAKGLERLAVGAAAHRDRLRSALAG